jgi:copper chaperone
MRSKSEGEAMRFHIQNMTCGGCARSVTKAVQSVDADAGIKIDLDTRFVDLTSAKPGTVFVNALTTAGFTAVPSA